MKFLQNVKNSIYSSVFYPTILTKSFKSSLGYFLLLVLCLTFIHLITLITPLLIDAPSAIQKISQDIINCFPKDLEVKIQNGQASVNTQEPYFLPPCGTLGQNNLVVIDTQTPFTAAQFDKYQAQAWVTKDSVIFKKNNYQTNTYSFAKIKDFKLNREVLNSYQKTLFPYLKFVGPLILLFSFIGIYLAYDFRLIQLLLLASLIWLLGKLFKYSLGYGQSYKLGLHAITLGFIVELLISLTRPWTHFYGFPFMVSILTLGVVTINLFLPKKSS